MGTYRLLLSQPHCVRFDQQPRNFVHRHTFFEPCLVTSGSGDFMHGGKHFKLRTGDLFIAEPGVFHEITSLKTRDLELLFTSFAVTEVEGSDRAFSSEDRIIRGFLNQHVVWRNGQHYLTDFFRWLVALNALADAPERSFLSEEAMRVLVLQIMLVLSAKPPATARADGKFEPALDRVLRAIDSRLREPIWVGELARACGMSERNLRRVFRQRLNRTVAQEIQERKVQRAATLLALPEFSIAEAGRQVGIDDAGQFSRLFRKVMGVSPSEYRSARIPPSRGRTAFATIGGVSMKTEFWEDNGNTTTRKTRVKTPR